MARFTHLAIISLWPALSTSCASESKIDTADTTDTTPTPVERFSLGEIQTCATNERLGFDRFINDGLNRGLTTVINPDAQTTPGANHTSLIAEDLDNDGDIDLSFNQPDSMPTVYENDGTGHFTLIEQTTYSEIGQDNRIFLTHAAADMNGDGLAELIFTGNGMVAVAENLGELRFGQPKNWVFFPELPYPSFQSFHLGDVDQDNDLEIFLSGSAMVTGQPNPGTETTANPEMLFRNTGDGFELEAELTHANGAGFSIMTLITDYDNDGDQDLQAFTDLRRRIPTAFYRNDGIDSSASVQITEESAALDANLRMSAMGIATGDYNRDGRLDYCISDIGPVKCLLSTEAGSFVESGVAMGLVPDLITDWNAWSGWSIEIEDLDNDGIEDAVIAAGLDMNDQLPEEQPDAIWKGIEPGLFEDWSVRTGFRNAQTHYTLATADFDGDGFLDILTLGVETIPELWMNQCDNQAWLGVELQGAGLNQGGFGTRVSITAGGQTQIREIQNLRSHGQSPSRAHFGLGDTTVVEELNIQWPDGTADTLTDFEPNRIIVVRAEQ